MVSNWGLFALEVETYSNRRYWERILRALEAEADNLGLCLKYRGDADFAPPSPDLSGRELYELQKAIVREQAAIFTPYLDDDDREKTILRYVQNGEGMRYLTEMMCGLGSIGLDLARVDA